MSRFLIWFLLSIPVLCENADTMKNERFPGVTSGFVAAVCQAAEALFRPAARLRRLERPGNGTEPLSRAHPEPRLGVLRPTALGRTPIMP